MAKKAALNVGFVGLGEMGGQMARNVVEKSDGRFEVFGFDLMKKAMNAAKKDGIRPTRSLNELAKKCDVIIVMVGFDHQVRQVVTDVSKVGKKGAVIVITATSHPDMVRECATIAKVRGMGVIDAPVCYGLDGARNGTLVSTVGGAKRDYNLARPVLECYSRAAPHLGELGAGEIGKTCNNMLHWAACVANYEVILLAKAYGIDGQAMRETLINCPGNNGTLERWDGTRFTCEWFNTPLRDSTGDDEAESKQGMGGINIAKIDERRVKHRCDRRDQPHHHGGRQATHGEGKQAVHLMSPYPGEKCWGSG